MKYARCERGILIVTVIFGEIVPQSICVRFGLPIGAACAPFVLLLMWIFAPISWPIAKLLDYLLGEDHGTTYKKAGLKTLVTLHKSNGEIQDEGLNEDEVSIISGVLDLKAKPVGAIMTPINDVFTLSSNAILDEDMMDQIMREGYSRIPIHQPNNDMDFVGMLLVKMLITYDPEDHKCVHEFSLATLPETRPDTSCLDIINFFQEGKSHMVLVSDTPGEITGALGVVTLEDVIEELIGEEIIDESDVYKDVHKAIRRMAPAPTHRARGVSRTPSRNTRVVEPEPQQAEPHDVDDEANGETRPLLGRPNTSDNVHQNDHRQSTVSLNDPKPSRTNSLMRRKSSGSGSAGMRSIQLARNPELRQQFKNLGPSNLASRPKSTRVNTIRIKPGLTSTTIYEHHAASFKDSTIAEPSATTAQKGIGAGTITPGLSAHDGAQALTVAQNGYGTLDKGVPYTGEASDANVGGTDGSSEAAAGLTAQVQAAAENSDLPEGFPEAHVADGDLLPELPEKLVFGRTRSNESEADSTVGSMHSGGSSPKHVHHSSKHQRKPTSTARSGSITESFVDANGVKKLVLETGPKPTDEPSSTASAIIADVHDSNEDTSGTVTPSEDQHNDNDNDEANGSVSAYHSSKAKPKKKKKKAKKNSISF